MRLRSFILAGLCAVLTLGAPAYAAAPANTKAAKADIAKTKSAAVELKQLKKKKKPTEADLARIQELEKQVRVERELAKEKVLEARKMAMREAAKAKADAARQEFLTKKGQKPVVQDADAEDAKSAKKLVKLETAKPVQPIPAVVEEPLTPEAQDVVSNGNNGELRSEPRPGETATRPNNGLFAGLFGGAAGSSSMSMLPQTRALDAALDRKQSKKPFKVKPEYEPQEVAFTGYEPGTIVINTEERRLYLVESWGTARRYAIAVGKEGLQYKGMTTVGDKQEWPRWIPTKDMQEREPKKYGQYKDGMPGGGANPLGARAIYLYDGKKDTHLRIHGTIAPQSIGTSASNGCFRMINDHVIELYNRVKMGTKVVVL
ncbi:MULTISPECIES: L,D-transpeptidase [Phyllobacteriaceae]|jgi:lipoprotein-anchoring transpeptidase ErfK/SrfK|uniref:L,D-TPase catalytic domain-containing protein n=1 Tax=Mesorhizobium hungaricum TaxID=1566387 RepID=A0A1C2DT10_9HYPH|nr:MULTISPECIES: L,D-transpeptidase [Mesorhizobium]MBN9236261.1 L,D-transpeptidase [Mesorhizobium sp.]MDQ0327839.1 lipoprotein-anchoring transpeptidase ErfK/SrfK [Mesorhizobium sp. YL-MeA3-2017]OCX17773.1 hypothetical protein QV13_13705 [Mesorhizobium hungaricum]